MHGPILTMSRLGRMLAYAVEVSIRSLVLFSSRLRIAYDVSGQVDLEDISESVFDRKIGMRRAQYLALNPSGISRLLPTSAETELLVAS